MTTKLFLLIIKYNFIASLVSVVLSFAFSQTNATGNEARQGDFIVFLLTVFLCFANLLLSLPGLLNARAAVYRHKFLRIISFAGLPFLALVLICTTFYTSDSTRKSNCFHVLMLKKYLHDLSHVINYAQIELQ